MNNGNQKLARLDLLKSVVKFVCLNCLCILGRMPCVAAPPVEKEAILRQTKDRALGSSSDMLVRVTVLAV